MNVSLKRNHKYRRINKGAIKQHAYQQTRVHITNQ